MVCILYGVLEMVFGKAILDVWVISMISHKQLSPQDLQLLREPPHGVLGSRKKEGQNNQGAGSRVGKMLGSREQGK